MTSDQRTPALLRLLLVLAVGLGLAQAAAAQPATGTEWRLDDFDKTLPPNEVYGKWEGRKFSPTFGSGDRYFFQFSHTAQEHALVLKSGSNNSFSVGLQAAFKVQNWPVLEWEWNIVQLPTGGDVRVKEKDDQAGSVCIVVNPGLTGWFSLCYLFENDGPKDTPITSAKNENARYLILRTAKAGDKTGQWMKEKRNVLEDYKRVFGKAPEHDAIFAVMIDSDNTKSTAEARYRNIILRKS